MRVALTAPSPWSEFSTAVACRLARAGFAPVGALTLPTWHMRTLVRKYRQSGGAFVRKALRRLASRSPGGAQNRALVPHRVLDGRHVETLRDCAQQLGFPILPVDTINGAPAVAAVHEWEADLLVYTGGGIVRPALLDAPRVGVLNAHESLLPHARGMDAAEWSLLLGRPLGVTVHFIDRGIDTGPIVLQRELTADPAPSSLAAARDLLAALAVDALVDAVEGLASGELRPVAQSRREEDLQHFVLHDTLRAHAERALKRQAETVVR